MLFRSDDDAPTYAVKELSEDVGGDLIGGILGSDMDRSNEDILLIDIGSTVQLALGNKDSILICSSESGPALEGGNVTFGMTPSIGAIDSIQYMDGEISYTVIGGTAPQGICGSGLIDLVSEMSENGIMDAVGKFTGKGKVFDSENGPAYTVTNDIYVTEGDIAAILKAKAAVRAGAIALMKEAKTDMKGISKVVVSGSFGIFINVDNAISIGLLPSLDKDKFDFLGNASMSYAVNILISEEVRNRADEVRKIITDIDFNEETYKEEVAESYPIPIRSTKESK